MSVAIAQPAGTGPAFTDKEKLRPASIDSMPPPYPSDSSDGDLLADEKDIDEAAAKVKSLRIQARGKHPIITLPIPSSERNIAVTREDGTLAYTSTRNKILSSNSNLTDATSGNVMSTKYGKRTSVTSEEAGSLEFKRNLFKSRRTFKVATAPNSVFEWQYMKMPVTKEKKLILIEKDAKDSKKYPKADPPKVLAELSRPKAENWKQKATLNPYRFGAGGELTMSTRCAEVLTEDQVVATALMMLKREQDKLVGIIVACQIITAPVTFL